MNLHIDLIPSPKRPYNRITVTHEGKEVGLHELSKVTGISYDLLYWRHRVKGMTEPNLIAAPHANRKLVMIEG